ncbi:MAG: ABC transporter ATP-binding protein [Spirochaetes bacterium]|nr:ABC transporter ATP-binding protein [Spirochaetota bacterium]
MADVKIVSLTKTFGDVVAVDDMSIEIKDREFFVLLGPTGAGKTTTLRLVAGLEKQDKGDILFDGRPINDLTPAVRDVAFVFQYYTLYPHYTVRQNLEFPLKSRMRSFTRQEIDKKVEEVAKTLHIDHLIDRATVNLSGGEMQRVALGRAMVRTPKVFLMDEPLSNLDAKLREEMRSEISRLHFDLGSTFFYVTHDQVEAMTMGDRVAVLNDGRILQVGTPDEIYNRPKEVFVAKFVGSPAINLHDARIKADTLLIGKDELVLTLTGPQKKALKGYKKDTVTFGIRPEDIEVRREKREKAFRCKVYFTQSMGAEDILNLKVDSVTCRALAAPRLLIKLGESVSASFDMNRAHLFDSETSECIL